MTVWGIADLHLSFAKPERRERHAARWQEHAKKIETEWRAVVQPEDLVLVPGDISMAGNHRDLQPDLTWLERLPGTKVLSPGNHDSWFNRIEAVRPLMRRSMRVVCGDAVKTNGAIVCGSRGMVPYIESPTPEQSRVRLAELKVLEAAINAAIALRDQDEPIYVLWHYPPFDLRGRACECVDMFESAGVASCVYGHLHAEGQWSSAVQGEVRGVRYNCVASDSIAFRPLRLSPR